MAKSAVVVYGEALFGIALEDGNLEERKQEVLWVKTVLEKSQDFIQFLLYPGISISEKERVVENILRSYISKDIMGLFLLLIKKGRSGDIEEILSYFLEKEKEYNSSYTGFITSAVLLTEKQRTQIEEKLLDMTGYKTIVLEYSVDKSLIGGLIIQIGNKIVDNSIKGKLNRIAKDLMKS